MKTVRAKNVFILTVVALSIVMALSGCGKTGNLYLPDEDGMTKDQKKSPGDEKK